MTRHSLAKDKIRILLLEGVHETAVEELRRNGYSQIEQLKTALDEAELIERIQGVHLLGIRSCTDW